METFYIRTYGCQMNELDSEILYTQLETRGLNLAKNENEADLVIFNTCSIRELSERKVLGKILELKNKNKIIGVAGCMSMAKKDTLLKEYPHIKFILGTNNLLDINNILDDLLKDQKQINKTDEDYEKNLENFFAKRVSKLKASISIIRGCNKKCSYCIVPLTRGKEVSRSKESVIKEANFLAKNGYKEITLLGQNVNSYGRDFKDKKYLFSDLLYELNKVQGIERIRFMTSHPYDICEDLMYAIRDLDKVCEFVHFPIQSGSNKILKKMYRSYSREKYLDKVYKLKEIVPNVSIGTDIITGFPGETDEDFEMTYQVFEEIQYDVAFIFAYSRRPNTPAWDLDDNVDQKIKIERVNILLDLYHKILREKYKKLIGTIQEVLVENTNSDINNLKGRTRRFEKVIFKGPDSLIGTLQHVKIESINHQTMIGSVLSN